MVIWKLYWKCKLNIVQLDSLKLNSHVTNLGENKRHKLEGTDKDLTMTPRQNSQPNSYKMILYLTMEYTG